MPNLVPVNGDPFAPQTQVKLKPVEGNPFAQKMSPQKAKDILDIFDPQPTLKPVKGNPFETGTITTKQKPRVTERDMAIVGALSDVLTTPKRLMKNVGEGVKDVAAGTSKLMDPNTLPVDAAGQIIQGIGETVTAPVRTLAKPLVKPLATEAITHLSKNQKDVQERASKISDDVVNLGLLASGVKGTFKGTPETITHAAIKDGENIITGENHAAAYKKIGKEQDGSHTEGFMTNKGRFISREEGAKLAQANGQVKQPLDEKGKLHSEDIARGQGRPPEQGMALPELTADELYKMSNRDEARRLQYVNRLKQIKGVDNATWEKLYAYKDNPKGVQLSPEEQALYKQHIEPIAARTEELYREFKRDGIDFGEPGGAPRRVKGMNAYIEKLYGNKPKEKGYATGGKKISSFSPALAGRTMWALPGEMGKRAIVYVDNGNLYHNGEKVGKLIGNEKPGAGVETSLGKLEQATTQEIENQTKLEYHKNLLANEYTRLQSLERAKDAKDFLSWLKQQPEFTEYAALKGDRDVPTNWRDVKVKELSGYEFDPRLAEQIEDYMGNIKSPEEFTRAIMNVARATKASIFINPIRHMINATNMFATSKGAVGTLRDLPNTPKAMGKAIKSVLTQDADFRAAAKEGLSLPSMRSTAQQFNQELMRAMGTAIRQNPRAFAQLAKDWGYNSTIGLVKALYSGSNKLLWAYSDILVMTRVNEYMARGLSRAEAIKRTEQVMANYRIPSRVMGQRFLSQGLQSPVATMFGRYDYNRFANLAGMIKRAAKSDPAGWEARDQLLALAALTTVGYQVIDKVLQQDTGKEGTHQDLGGYSSMINAGKQTLEGKKSPRQLLLTEFLPGFISTPIELLTGSNMYTGKDIAQRGDWNNMVQQVGEGDFSGAGTSAARMGYDIARYGADKFMPIADLDRFMTSDITPAEYWLSWVGTSIPSEQQEAGQAKAGKYARQQAKSAAKKRGF